MLPSENLVWELFPYQQDQNHIQLEVQASPPTELLKFIFINFTNEINILDRLVGYQLSVSNCLWHKHFVQKMSARRKWLRSASAAVEIVSNVLRLKKMSK